MDRPADRAVCDVVRPDLASAHRGCDRAHDRSDAEAVPKMAAQSGPVRSDTGRGDHRAVFRSPGFGGGTIVRAGSGVEIAIRDSVSASYLKQVADGVCISVRAQPNAKRSEIAGLHGN